MKLRKILPLIIAASLLSACSASTGSDKPRLRLDDADKSLTQPCEDPAKLPENNKGLTQIQVETMWSQDRKNLKICKQRHRGVVDYYTTRDKNLRRN